MMEVGELMAKIPPRAQIPQQFLVATWLVFRLWSPELVSGGSDPHGIVFLSCGVLEYMYASVCQVQFTL